MPLVEKQERNNGFIALWQITETQEELMALLDEKAQQEAKALKNPNHYLASRSLVQTLCKSGLYKDAFGKPFLEDAQGEISISHSGDYAFMGYSANGPIGVDIEKMQERIRKIIPKFTHESEQIFIKEHDLKGAYLLWSAKESVYKYYGRKALDFKAHIRIEYEAINADEGCLWASITKDNYRQRLQIYYRFFDAYIITEALEVATKQDQNHLLKKK